MRWLVRLAKLQGAYFAITGLWPLVHLASFETVTGPKTDDWLVKTVGILVLAIGIALLVAAARLRVGFETAILAIATAAALATIDLVYVLDGTLRWVYALDAAAQIALAALWTTALWRARDEPALWGRSLHRPERRRARQHAR